MMMMMFDDDADECGDAVVTEAELMSSVQQRGVADVSFDSLQQSGQYRSNDYDDNRNNNPR